MRVAVLPENLRDLSPLLIERNLYVPPPAELLARTTWQERAMFGHVRGMYVLPTAELVEWLRGFIGDRFALEIGAGCGALARALGILATDNLMQTWPHIAAHYRAMGQPVIEYGPEVEDLGADEAVAVYRPDVVLGAWITHRYDEAQHERGGSVYGPDFAHILRNCSELVLVCNTDTHAAHTLMDIPHRRVRPPGLFSRAQSGEDFIGIWKGGKA